MSLRFKFAVLVTGFLTVIVLVLAQQFLTAMAQVDEIERRQRVIPMSAGLNATIKALQIERGRTVGLISSGGSTENRAALDAQRQVCLLYTSPSPRDA